MELQEEKCPLCSSSEYKFVANRINNTSKVRCLSCSLHYMNPMYSEKKLDELYKKTNYFENYGNGNYYIEYNERAKSNVNSNLFYRIIHGILPFFNAGKELEAIFRLR